jgi:hypothetical protein
MNQLKEIRDKWSWEEVFERENIFLVNGNVDVWLENISTAQSHTYLYYDIACTQLLLHHTSQIKTIVNCIIDNIKKREFSSRRQIERINSLIDLDTLMTEEFTKMQKFFKQDGTLLSEASKLIHYLDSTTLNTSNMVKTMLEYHTMVKLNKQMLQIKLKQDTDLWEIKRKKVEQYQVTKRRSITVGEDNNNETIKITFS